MERGRERDEKEKAWGGSYREEEGWGKGRSSEKDDRSKVG